MTSPNDLIDLTRCSFIVQVVHFRGVNVSQVPLTIHVACMPSHLCTSAHID